MLLSTGSSSAGPIELGVRFALDDQFSGPVKRMQDALKGMTGEYKSLQDNLRAARTMSVGMAAAGMGLTMGMASAVRDGAEFIYMMKSVEAVSSASADQMDRLNEKAVQIGRETMFYPKDIAEGMRFMAMAGQKAETIHKTISAATNLAGATLTHLGGKMGAADIMTNALKAFGWEAERSAEMSDILVLAANNANVTLTDLGNSIRYVAATSRNLNIPVQETTGFLMTLGNAGIQASMAGVAVENMYRYLAASLSKFSTKRATEAWKTLGIPKQALVDAKGNLKPMVEVLDMIRTGLAGRGSVDTQNILRDIFGVRGLRSAATVLRNLDEAKGFIDMLNDPANAGTAANKMETMMDNIRGSILRFSSAFDGLKVKFTKVIEGPLRFWLESGAKVFIAIERFIDTGFGSWLVKIGASAIIASTAIWSLRAAFTALAYAVRTLNVSYGAMRASTGIAMSTFMGKVMPHKAKLNPVTMYRTTPGTSYARTQGGGLIKHIGGRAYSVSPEGGVKRMSNTAAFRYGGPISRTPPSLGAPFAHRPAVNALIQRPAISAMARMGGGAAMLGRGLMAVVGGWPGLALIGLSIGIPMLVNHLGNNTRAVQENTDAMKNAAKTATSSDLYAVLAQKRMVDLVEIISQHLDVLVKDRKMDMKAVIQALENNDMGKLVEFLGTNIFPNNPSNLQMIPQ